MTFTSVEQRIAHAYLDTFPAFVPDEASGIPAAGQQEFHTLMRLLYQLVYDEPSLLAPALHEDDAIPNHMTKTAYGKPDLVKNMRRFARDMDTLLLNLFALAAGQPAALTKRHQAVLARLGIGTALPAAWTWMATRPGASPVSFAHCFFAAGYPYISGLYARLLGDEAAFRKLEGWMTARGYRQYECLNVTASDDKITLTYANPAWGPDTPSGGFEYKVRHTGIATRYDAMAARPATFGLCIPGGMKDCLAAFDRMDAPLRAFVFARTKVCDGCRYCVQTDKTGTRPLANVRVTHKGETRALCTYFPGYRYSWTAIDGALADDLIAMLAFLDGLRDGAEKGGSLR